MLKVENVPKSFLLKQEGLKGNDVMLICLPSAASFSSSKLVLPTWNNNTKWMYNRHMNPGLMLLLVNKVLPVIFNMGKCSKRSF